MTHTPDDTHNGATRVEYLLGAPLAEDAVRQWPQMGEVVHGRQLIADIEGNFPDSLSKSAGDTNSAQPSSSGGPAATATVASAGTPPAANSTTAPAPASPTAGANQATPPSGGGT